MSVHAARAKFRLFSILLAFIALTPAWASAADRLHRPFDGIVVFGDSLSDPGNAFALTGQHLTPPSYGMDTAEELLTLVPSAPYAKGGNHFSNGPTWIEDLGKAIGLGASAGPAFAPGHPNATNYAVGGARARAVGAFHLSVQVNAFLADFPRGAPADTLFVVALGGNDVRDALQFGDPTVIAAAIGSIANHIGILYGAGARKFLVWNSPNIAVTPAVRAVAAVTPGVDVLGAATALSLSFKNGLDFALTGLEADPRLAGIEIVRFDAFTEINNIVANPARFGLNNVTTACITPNVPPFQCRQPDRHLFWDGIHPTRAGGHAIAALLVGKTLVVELVGD
jgi:phospholipase/lecithinase/hemolysin